MVSEAHVDDSRRYGPIWAQISELKCHFAATETLIESKTESLANISLRYAVTRQNYIDDDLKDVFVKMRTQLAQLLQVASGNRHVTRSNTNSNSNSNIEQKLTSLKDPKETHNGRNKDIFGILKNNSQDSLASIAKQTDVLRNITNLAPLIQTCVDELVDSISILSEIAPYNETNKNNLKNMLLLVEAVVDSFGLEPRIRQ